MNFFIPFAHPTQAGDSVWNPAPEVQQFVTVNDPNKEDQTIEWEQTLNDYLVGDSVLLFAKASSGLVVSYISANTNIAFIEGDMLHVVGSGQVIITAIQAGDSVWNPAKVEKTFLIVLDTAKRNQEILWNQTLAYTLGDLPIPLTAEATSGKKVRYTSGNTNVALVLHDSELGDLLVIVGPGMSTITATQEGDSIYNPAPVEKQLFTTTKGYWPFDSCVTTLECNFFMLNLRTLRANINANNEALGLDTVIILHARWYLDGEEEQHELQEGVSPAREFIAGSSYSAGRKAGDRMKDGTYHFVLRVREINAQDTGKFNELDLRSGDRIIEGCSEGATTTKLTVYPNPAAGNRSIFVRAALDASPRADNMVRVYNVVTGALVKEVPRTSTSDLTEITLTNNGYYDDQDNEMPPLDEKGIGEFRTGKGKAALKLTTSFMVSLEGGWKFPLPRELTLLAGVYFDYGLNDVGQGRTGGKSGKKSNSRKAGNNMLKW